MKGQALVTLLFFMVIATTITTAAVLVIVVNSTSGARFQEGAVAYQVAQSGVDNALLRLLRNTDYSGEVLEVGEGTATVIVTGSNPYTINSRGQIGNYIKRIEVVTHYSNDQLIIDSQKEVF